LNGSESRSESVTSGSSVTATVSREEFRRVSSWFLTLVPVCGWWAVAVAVAVAVRANSHPFGGAS